jgi:acyl-coenzyme A thioesterase PaaI-like protein
MATAASSHDHLKLQPNSRHCFACGLHNPVGLRLRFEDDGQDEVRTTYRAPAHFEGYPGVVHGGIVTALLDEIVGRTPMIADPNHFMMTVKLEVKFRQPVPVETPLTITGRMCKRRGRLATAQAELRLPNGTLAAEAEAVLADLPADLLEGRETELLDWRIWPQE